MYYCEMCDKVTITKVVGVLWPPRQQASGKVFRAPGGGSTTSLPFTILNCTILTYSTLQSRVQSHAFSRNCWGENNWETGVMEIYYFFFKGFFFLHNIHLSWLVTCLYNFFQCEGMLLQYILFQGFWYIVTRVPIILEGTSWITNTRTSTFRWT